MEIAGINIYQITSRVQRIFPPNHSNDNHGNIKMLHTKRLEGKTGIFFFIILNSYLMSSSSLASQINSTVF